RPDPHRPRRLRRGGVADGPRQPTRPTRSGARGRDVARAGDRVATADGAAQRPALFLRAVEPGARRGARRRVPARDGGPRAGRALVLRRVPTPFCPSAALPETGSFVARDAAGIPILAVRGNDGRVRAFRNACRHRGTQLVDGSGCEKAFVCPYHGWTYGLDGALRHVPDEDGFPGLEKSTRGLVPVETAETSGVVFVTQDAPGARLEALPPLIPSDRRLVATFARDVPANWKVVVEGFLEGYHIRSTHQQTFYPVQFDNLNVVETFGRNSRVTFPYRAINKLRAIPPEERSVEGKLTYVYHLFPNAIVATFPTFMAMVVLEPVAIDRTNIITYALTKA